jgi:foldase protein PrsA
MRFASKFRTKKVNPVRKLVLLLVLFALVAAACSGGGAAVATVNGAAITLEEVEEIRVGGSVANRDEFNQDLFQLIVEETVRQAATADFAVVADAAAIDEQYDLFVASVEGPLDEFLETNGVTEEAIRHFAFQQVVVPEIRLRLVEQADPLDDETIQIAYDQLLPNLTTVCTRHILVGTEGEASAVLDRLDGGEDFGELAAELSTDTGSGANGGDVGCMTESDMVQSFVSPYTEAALSAPIGEVTDPVQSDFGYHVIIVDSREAQTLDEIRTDLEASLVSQQVDALFDEWVFESLGTADVVVTERYGTWQTEPTFGVNSPA